MHKQPQIETERLILLQFKQDDAERVSQLAGNYNVAKTTLNIPHPYQRYMAENWIDTHQQAWDTRQAITYAIYLRKI